MTIKPVGISGQLLMTRRSGRRQPPRTARRRPLAIKSRTGGEDWQHESLGRSHWCCSRPPASPTTCVCEVDAARLTRTCSLIARSASSSSGFTRNVPHIENGHRRALDRYGLLRRSNRISVTRSMHRLARVWNDRRREKSSP